MGKEQNFEGVRGFSLGSFAVSWEQRKLGELAVFNPKEEIPDVFEYVDLESVVDTEMLSHRTEEKATAPSRAQRLAHTGDLFYQTVRPYQKNNYLFEKPDKHYVFSTGYAQLRPFIDGYFLLSLVQNGQFVKTVLDNCTGTSYPAINANDLAEIEVFSPKDEQEHHQIGTYFRNLDNLITLHQRNSADFVSRFFSDFTNTWEQRKAKELCNIGTGKSNTQDQVENGLYPFYIRSDIPVKSNKYLYDCEAVITIGDGNIGRVFHYVNGKFDLHQRCYKMTDFQDIWGKYFYYFFSTRFYDRAMKMTAKATVDSVRLEMISEMDIWKPIQIDEQKKIAEFFTNLDNLITLHQCEYIFEK